MMVFTAGLITALQMTTLNNFIKSLRTFIAYCIISPAVSISHTVEPSGGVMKEGAGLKTPLKFSQRQLCCCCCILLLRFYGWAVVFSSCELQTVCCSVKEGLYGSRVHHARNTHSCALLLYSAAHDVWLGSCYIG